MNELVSVIVPVYNVEKYLRECVESIIHQTYQEIEIILVDDGSTDNSGKICDEFAEKDKRIRVFHKENQGVSSTRNMGLDVCQGEYITFIDSDDYVDKEYVKVLINDIKKFHADIAVCNFMNVYPNGKSEKLVSENSCQILVDNRFDFCKYEYIGYVWGKLFKTEIAKKYCFNLKLSVLEDLVYIVEILQTTKFLYYNEKTLYYYRQNLQSVLHSIDITKRKDAVLAWKKIVAMQTKESVAYQSAIMCYVKSCRRVAGEIYLFENKESKEIKFLQNEVKKYMHIIKKVDDSFMQKMTLWLFAYMPRIYYEIFRMKQKKDRKKLQV